MLVEVFGIQARQQRVQHGPRRERSRGQFGFEQGNGFFVGIFLPGLQQPDFVEQRPHVSRLVASLFRLLIDGLHQWRGRGGLVLLQQGIDFFPAGGIGTGRHGCGRVGAKQHGQKQEGKQEQTHRQYGQAATG